MASWLDNYRQASFRNVKFFVRAHDFTGGRRKTKFQYPGSDRVDFQDHGIKSKDFSIRVYLLGENYYQERNLLIDALDKKGPGKLVHPYIGTLTVEVQEYSVSENSDEGRMVRISISLSEVSTDIRTAETINTQTKVYNAREAALLAIDNAFRAAYSVVRKPFTVIDNVQKTIDIGFTAIRDAKTIFQTVAEYQDQIKRLLVSIPTLFREVIELAASTQEALDFGTTLEGIYKATADNARLMFDDFIDLFGFTPGKIIQVEDDPSVVFAQLVDYSTVVVAGSLLSVIDFTNYNDAVEIREILFKEIDRILLTYNVDDDVYVKLYSFRTEVFNDIESRIGDLSRTSIVVLPDSTPAIILSYELYGTIDNEQSIIDRNNIENPGFVDANIPIEVETNV